MHSARWSLDETSRPEFRLLPKDTAKTFRACHLQVRDPFQGHVYADDAQDGKNETS